MNGNRIADQDQIVHRRAVRLFIIQSSNLDPSDCFVFLLSAKLTIVVGRPDYEFISPNKDLT